MMHNERMGIQKGSNMELGPMTTHQYFNQNNNPLHKLSINTDNHFMGEDTSIMDISKNNLYAANAYQIDSRMKDKMFEHRGTTYLLPPYTMMSCYDLI